jgi:ABC-type transport system involved in multi-copper enzyme maturation permease subunit
MSAAAGILLREWMAFRRALGRSGMIRFLVLYCGVLGYFVPSRFGDPSAAAIVFAIMPLYIAGPLAIDSFAGERERKTLETLLCSPAGSGAIVTGKALFPVLASLAVSWLSFAIFCGISILRSVPVPCFSAAAFSLALGVCLSCLASTTGLHVSLGARSTRGAMQWYSIILLAVSAGIPLVIGPMSRVLSPDARESLAALFAGEWLSPGTGIVLFLLLASDAGLMVLLRRRGRGLRILNRAGGSD